MMNRTILGIALAGLVIGASAGHAQDDHVALQRTVSDADRGVRATITYRPEVPTGGQDEIINSDGTVSILHWDGLLGQFTTQITDGTLAEDDAEAFLREAVIAVCPSVDRDQLERASVQTDGPFLRVFAQCPEVDARLQ